MNMIDMIQEAQEICEKARASVATEDYMDAAYKLCDLQVLLVRMEYEAGWDPVVRAVEEMAPKAPAEPKIGDVYSGQTTVSVKDNLNSAHVVCSPEEMRQATVSEHRFDNMPNPTPTVTQDPAQTHIDVPAEWGTVEGEEDMEPTITDLRDEEIPHTSEVTSGSRFTLGGILGRH